MLRAEASKAFWADPHTYYHVDAAWLVDGGWPGRTCHDMSFLDHVQNIEIEYGIDADRMLNLRGSLLDVNYSLVHGFWTALKKRFPRVKRIVINQNWGNKCLASLAKACPPSIDVSVLVNGPYIGAEPVGHSTRNKRSLHRFVGVNGWEELASGPRHKTVLIPMRKFTGPVGEYEKAKYVALRLDLQRHGLGAMMMAALDQHHFEPEDFHKVQFTPRSCPMTDCDQDFWRPGSWTIHGISQHSDDLIPGQEFLGWPEELRCLFIQRNLEFDSVYEKLSLDMNRIHCEWNEPEGGERSQRAKRREIRQGWMEQLDKDENWKTGEPAGRSALWKAFEARANTVQAQIDVKQCVVGPPFDT
ncbi:hypothetical protein N0V90_012342 [Kalmusia sp. IMI 367209]|nr:hypothetical protein N0V90_012342 [Kalmusia sp. IMI 367209]